MNRCVRSRCAASRTRLSVLGASSRRCVRDAVRLGEFPSGQPPFLPRLRSRFHGVVRRLLWYYGAVRLPGVVRHRRGSLDFPMRSALPVNADNVRLSRFPCEMFPCMRGVCDRAGSPAVSQ